MELMNTDKAGKKQKGKKLDVFALIGAATSQEDLEPWDGTLQEYLPLVIDNPKFNDTAHARIWRMIEAAGIEFDEDDKDQKHPRYKFFTQDMYGINDTLARLMEDYFKAAAVGSDVSKRILLLYGPTSSGKSDFTAHIKAGLERFSRTAEGKMFAIKGCPMHENPLNAIPKAARADLKRECGLVVEGGLCPVCALRLKQDYDGDWRKLPVERIFLSEDDRIGIGTFQPADPKCCVLDTLVLTDQGPASLGVLGSHHEQDISVGVLQRNGEAEKADKFYLYKNQPTRKITTRLGYSVEVTPNHPLAVGRADGSLEWVLAKNIAKGDSLALGVGQGFGHLEPSMTKAFAEFLGLYVAEGNFSKESSVEINNISPYIHQMVAKAGTELGLRVHSYAKKVVLCSTDLVKRMREMGFSTGAHSKEIPECVMRSGQLLPFLRGLWLGDGNCGRHASKHTNEATYSTVSVKLAKQVHILLLALGIPSNLQHEPDVGTSGAYKIVVGSEYAAMLKTLLDLPDWKLTRPLADDIRYDTNVGFLPKLGRFAKAVCDSAKGLSAWHRYTCPDKDYGRGFTKRSLRAFLREAEEAGADANLIAKGNTLLKPGIIFLDVEEIEDGRADVADVRVPSSHAFIGNGFISHNSQDQAELTGSINLSKITEYGSESDPRAFDFNGELNVANRGAMEFIELLKVDPKFRHILLTLAEEKKIKAPRFPLIHADLAILSHSVAGDSPVPYRQKGVVRIANMRDLCDAGDTDIEVLARGQDGNPVWTKVKSFYRHQFSGKMVRTFQAEGTVETTWHHSLIDRDGNVFLPEERKNVCAFRTLPPTVPMSSVVLDLPPSLHDVEGKAYVRPTGDRKRDGEFGKYSVRVRYDCTDPAFRDMIRVLCWYVTEGHVSDAHAIISQANVDVLASLKQSAENISSTKGSILNRSDKEDGTSRLHLSARVWRELLEYNCGKYSQNKRLPDFFLNLPRELMEFALWELVAGDGQDSPSFNSRPDYAEKYFTYKTVSPILAAQISYMVAALGHDFGMSHGYTKTGKQYFGFQYRERTNDTHRNNRTECTDVDDVEVFDIECVENHSFVSGIGNIVCHNTNETEYKKFLAQKEEEAIQSRMIVRKFPYNLEVDAEVKIYEKLLLGVPAFNDIHIAPHTLRVAAMFAVLTRLEKPKDEKITLLKKMRAYNGDDIEGLGKDDIKNLKDDAAREGMEGIDPRYVVNRLSACFVKHGVNYITPISALRSIEEGLDTNAQVSDDDRERYKGFISDVIEEYSKLACNEVQKAFFLNFESEIKDLLNNYIDNALAYLNEERVENEWGDYEEPDERLMRKVEEKIGITDGGKRTFREEVSRKMLALKAQSGEYDYKAHARLNDALKKQLFDERSDIIRLTVNVRNPDPDALKRLNEVIATLSDQYGYTPESANELLRYVSSIMAKSE